MRRVLLMMLAIVSAFGCHHVGSLDGDTGPVECNLGEYSGDFTISPQSDIADIAGYTSISGDLKIEWLWGDVDNEGTSYTDLSELICLTSVGGRLSIYFNTAITNLDGLSALISVGGDLSIDVNPALTNLDGLGALTSVGGTLHISDADALTNLDGLSGITSVGGVGLLIDNNNSLTNLDGLSGITSVIYLTIYCNDALTNLDGLGGLTSVGALFIFTNPALTNLDGLSALTSVSGNNLFEDFDDDVFGINHNAALPDCEVCDLLDQLTTGPTSIDVHDNFADSCTPVPAGCP